MQASEEKDDSPLLDADISRLIKLSREVGYKKQDDIPQRNLVDFKPLSIDKIVAEVGSKPSKPDVSNKAEDKEQTSLSNLEAKENNTQDQKEETQTETGLNDDKIEENKNRILQKELKKIQMIKLLSLQKKRCQTLTMKRLRNKMLLPLQILMKLLRLLEKKV